MSIRLIPEITAEQENLRSVEFIPGNPLIQTLRRDPVEPVPVGSYVAMIFRVTGYDPDCDGSLMGRFEAVDRNGEPTGYEMSALGIYPDTEVLLDGPGDLHDLADPSSVRGGAGEGA